MTNRKALNLSEKVSVLERQALCYWCGKPLTDKEDDKPTEYDHIVALARGGADSPENMKAIHHSCHLIKTSEDRKRIALRKRRAKRIKKKDEKNASRQETKPED